MKKKLLIEGMTCNHCRMRVENALKWVPGISRAAVNLAEGSALVELEGASDDSLREAVAEAGYTVTAVTAV